MNCPTCSTVVSAKFGSSPYWMCPNCDVWFQDPLPPKKFQASDEVDEYGKHNGYAMSDGDKAVNQYIAESLVAKMGESKKSLDIGAKYPYFAHCMNNLGCEAYAVDGIEEANDFAKELGVPMLRADFEAMTSEQIAEWTKTSKFDIITMFHVFEHMYNPLEALRKLRSLIKDDGFVFLRFPDHATPGFESHLSQNHYEIHPYYWSLPAFLELLYQGQDLFTVRETATYPNGVRDIELRPLKRKPSLWCGMIVKNEERDLPKCLNSIKDVADGLVIIDTGSVDKTIDVAKETWNHKPLDIQTYTGASKQDEAGDWKLWDFSKARNVFVDKIDAMAHADYLIWMDADDIMLTPQNFRRAIYMDQYQVFGVMIETHGMKWIHHRMWKVRNGINFEGRIHEYPNFGNRPGIDLVDCVIMHDAEPGVVGENSNQRNLRILEAEFEENPSSRTAFYLANTHKDAGRWPEAIKYYNARIDMGQFYRDEWLFAYLYRGRCERVSGNTDQAEKTFLEALSHAPNWSEYWMELAFMAYEQGNWTKATGYALEASCRAPESTQLWRERNMYTDQPLRLLSFCAGQLGEKEQALEWALKAQKVIGADVEWSNHIVTLRGMVEPAPTVSLSKGPAPKIALHRPGAIGDIIITLNLIPLLKKKYPKHEIHYFCHPAIGANLNELIRLAGVDEWYDNSQLEAKAGEYEKVINLIGYPLKDGYPEKPMAKHLLEYFGREMGLDINPDEMPRLVLDRWPRPLANMPKRYATIHVQAGWSHYKNWAFGRWEKVLEACGDIPVYQIGSATDYKIAGADHSLMGSNLKDSIALMSNATMHMGVDSFTNHLTNVKWKGKGQTPSVILWGSTQWQAAGYKHNRNISLGLECQPCFREDPKISGSPRGVCINPPDQEDYNQPRHACMAGISVEQVVEAVKGVWKENAGDRTLLFCTYKDGLYPESRLERWINWYSKFNATLCVVNDGPRLSIKGVTNLGFDTSLGRNPKGVTGDLEMIDFPGWFRSFFTAVKYAAENGYSRVVHCELDAFVTSDNLKKKMFTWDKGWHTMWCPRWNCNESAIQVINQDMFETALAKYDECQAMDWMPGTYAEIYLPFTQVHKEYVGDRYGEFMDKIPSGHVDYMTQCKDDWKIK